MEISRSNTIVAVISTNTVQATKITIFNKEDKFRVMVTKVIDVPHPIKAISESKQITIQTLLANQQLWARTILA